MSYFDIAVELVLKHEGGFSDHEKDKGGATNYGISLRLLKQMGIDITGDGLINSDDILSLSIEDAKEIYRKEFWDRHGYDGIDSLVIASKVMDLAVNIGGKNANKLIQKAVNIINHHALEVDGVLGSKSFKAINKIINDDQEEKLLKLLKKGAQFFYERLVEDNPELKVFLKGWLRRVEDDVSKQRRHD